MTEIELAELFFKSRKTEDETSGCKEKTGIFFPWSVSVHGASGTQRAMQPEGTGREASDQAGIFERTAW